MRVLLCDLDDTLFDHQQATRTALWRIRATDARLQAWSPGALVLRHTELLERFHLEVLAGRMNIDQAREARFAALVGGDAAGLAAAYRDAYLADWRVVPGARELLTRVRQRGARVVIVTNNLVSEQRAKLDRIGLTDVVDGLVTSEAVGAQKPDPKIFEVALSAAAASPEDAVMLGDSWAADVVGARRAGIRPVWFNRWSQPTPDATVAEIRTLEEMEKWITR